MDESHVPGNLRTVPDGPHLAPAHAVAVDEPLESAAGEDGVKGGPEPPLRQHREHDRLRQYPILVLGPDTQVSEQSQQHSLGFTALWFGLGW